MTTQAHNTTTPTIAPITLGASIVALAGVGLVAYGIMFLIRNFNGFIELGITPALIGTTAEELQRANPLLYHYISHLQVALSELTDFDCARFHNQQRVDVPSVPPPGPVLGNVTERAMIPA